MYEYAGKCKRMSVYKILIINPGSTSTKLSLYENERCVVTEDTFHDSSVLLQFPTINDQLAFRMGVLREFLKRNGTAVAELDAIVGRGGGCHPVESGTYHIDETLVKDTRDCVGGLYHSSMLGVQMAWELRDECSGLMLMMDPIVVDELCDMARVTGVKGVYHRAGNHALNLKAVARKHAEVLGKRYEDSRLIVCHIDGGVSISAHKDGKMFDGNNGSGGDGPMSPTRMGGMAITDLLRCFPDGSNARLKDLCSQAGGFSSHFGTSNSDTVHGMVEAGDPRATRVWNTMLYQIAKYIGSMAAALEGKVDAIVLTGGLLRFADVEETIRKYCAWIAPIACYPGEMEQDAMTLGALRVLRGEEAAKIYSGKPVWSGFPDE